MADAKKVSRKVGHGRGTGIPDDPESVRRAMSEIATAPWVTTDTMSTALGIGKGTGYAMAREGRFGAFKVGAQFRVPCVPLREALHLPPAPAPQPEAA